MGDAIGRTVMSPQGLTILGGLAIAAYEHFQEKKQAATPGTVPEGGTTPISDSPPTPPPFTPPATPGPAVPAPTESAATLPAVEEERARLLITAMVSAAKADGAIDDEERSRILGHLAERGATEADRAYLEEEMARPLSIDRLVSQVQGPVPAAEVYAASLLAIDPDTPAEKAYLALLAARLNLEPGLIRELETRLDAGGV
jgi:uncharacterized membrane protein YebE (DUF533 family)